MLPGGSNMMTRENMAEASAGLESQFRVSDKPNLFDDYINPLNMIGGMAANLGQAPLASKQSNSNLPYVTAIGAPLTVGALSGLGTNNTRQFINNLTNPLAGTGDLINNLGNKHLPNAASSVNDVGKGLTQASKQWQLEELPGLHLKSTMEGEAISKIVDKTGKINTEQALGIIGKESGGADKVKLIKEALGENIPKKMDYNEFRKVVQDQLIPLERQFATGKSNYGISNLGYPSQKRSDYEATLNHLNTEKGKQLQIIKEYEKYLKNPNKYKKAFPYGDNLNETNNELLPHIKSTLDNYKQKLANTERLISESIEDMKLLPLENQTLILGNKSKFGRGSSAHNNPEETLGHIHFLRDAETPDVLTVTQIQSDAFQGTHRIMPNKKGSNLEIDKWKKMLTSEGRKELEETGGKEAADLAQQGAREFLKKAEKEAAEILGPNPLQKQLLDKNHQERYLQELVDYAGKRGDINKIRIPTRETAAEVQGYNPMTTAEEVIKKYNEAKGTPEFDKIMSDASNAEKAILKKVLKGEIKGNIYDLDLETILKKYSEQPKTIKKLFGIEPKVVTDSKGNTWYEFDIPDKAKKGKMEIKAFTTTGAAIGAGAAALSQQPQETPTRFKS